MEHSIRFVPLHTIRSGLFGTRIHSSRNQISDPSGQKFRLPDSCNHRHPTKMKGCQIVCSCPAVQDCLAGVRFEPFLDPLGFDSPNIAQRHALHVERTAEKAVMLSDRVSLSSAEARVEEIKGGSVGVFDFSHPACARTHTKPKSAVLRLMVSDGWSIRSPITDTPQGERGGGSFRSCRL